MQVRLIFALAIFLASYLPLSVILLTQDLDYERLGQPICFEVWGSACEVPLKNPWFSAVALGVCGAGLIATFVTLHIIRPRQQITIQTSKHVPADLMNYVLPYVVSFMGITYGEPDKLAGFAVFLAWIFLITYKSGQVIMNPVLSVFGWRLYEIEFLYHGGGGHTHTGLCLSQITPEACETHRHAAIQDILIIKKVSDAPSA